MTENGTHSKEDDRHRGGLAASGSLAVTGGSLATSGGSFSLSASAGSLGASGGVPYTKSNRKLSLPARALQGKYEPLSKKGIAIFHVSLRIISCFNFLTL